MGPGEEGREAAVRRSGALGACGWMGGSRPEGRRPCVCDIARHR